MTDDPDVALVRAETDAIRTEAGVIAAAAAPQPAARARERSGRLRDLTLFVALCGCVIGGMTSTWLFVDQRSEDRETATCRTALAAELDAAAGRVLLVNGRLVDAIASGDDEAIARAIADGRPAADRLEQAIAAREGTTTTCA
jgi:hypothetical protein